MSLSLVAACIWVFCATATALLPMRHQYIPGVTLLILAPVLILWLGSDLGWGWSLAAFAGFVSMFRNPLRYFYARARGQSPELPK